MVDVDAKSTLEFVYPQITQEQRAGNAPYNNGGEWVGENNEIELSDHYIGDYLEGEVAHGVICKGEIWVSNDVRFFVFGFYEPCLQVFNKRGRVFCSDDDSPKIFINHFGKYLKNEVFSSKFGKLFLDRIKLALDFCFEIE